jgi:hypothetical protein
MAEEPGSDHNSDSSRIAETADLFLFVLCFMLVCFFPLGHLYVLLENCSLVLQVLQPWHRGFSQNVICASHSGSAILRAALPLFFPLNMATNASGPFSIPTVTSSFVLMLPSTSHYKNSRLAEVNCRLRINIRLTADTFSSRSFEYLGPMFGSPWMNPCILMRFEMTWKRFLIPYLASGARLY